MSEIQNVANAKYTFNASTCISKITFQKAPVTCDCILKPIIPYVFSTNEQPARQKHAENSQKETRITVFIYTEHEDIIAEIVIKNLTSFKLKIL